MTDSLQMLPVSYGLDGTTLIMKVDHQGLLTPGWDTQRPVLAVDLG